MFRFEGSSFTILGFWFFGFRFQSSRSGCWRGVSGRGVGARAPAPCAKKLSLTFFGCGDQNERRRGGKIKRGICHEAQLQSGQWWAFRLTQTTIRQSEAADLLLCRIAVTVTVSNVHVLRAPPMPSNCSIPRCWLRLPAIFACLKRAPCQQWI